MVKPVRPGAFGRTNDMRAGGDNCFVELRPLLPLPRRALIEGAGSFLLMFVIVGTGMLAQQPTSDALLRKFVAAVAISGALVGLILALGPLSGGHLNPLISALQWFPGRSRTLRCALLYVIAQAAGACAGAACANVVLDGDAIQYRLLPISGQRVASEAVCSMGLMTIVFAASTRGGRRDAGPIAVGAWLVAAIVTAPSSPYANPAVTLAATIADGSVRLSAGTVAAYVGAQFVGALIAFAIIATIFPRTGPKGREDAAAVAAWDVTETNSLVGESPGETQQEKVS
jgi:glycerol uptake facilitator-like aquaporin